ncbi:MAG TPA: hypothetical protein VIM61_15050 [Chthoniobacterales bacterium]|jgi:hypothetical protein
MNASLKDYVVAAFNARPLGMPIPPNWIGVAGIVVVGLLNPGFWLIGAGLEVAYLLGLAHLPRFRAVIDARLRAASEESEESRLRSAIAQLDESRRQRFLDLRAKCDAILREQRMDEDSAIGRLQRDGLDRLLALHLHLLTTQAAMERLLQESNVNPASLGKRIEKLRAQAGDPGLGEEHRRSLLGQVEILERRRGALAEGTGRLAFSDSELARIEEQVALIGDEVRLATSPESIGSQIDRVAGELDETRRWISEQQSVFSPEIEAPWSSTSSP